MNKVKEWLREKQSRGVKDVRVSTVLAQVEEAEQQAAKNGSGRKLDLVGTAEAAEILGVERPRIGRWLDRCKHCGASYMKGGWEEPCIKGHRKHESVMPEPVQRLRSGPVWERSQIAPMKGEREKRRRGSVAA